MSKILSKQRFDDVGEGYADGTVDYAYRGYHYVVEVDGCAFKVRTYDDESGIATIVTADARTKPQANELAAFVLKELSVSELRFYCGTVGSFKTVNLQTLEFVT